jgi:hypothetical protein
VTLEPELLAQVVLPHDHGRALARSDELVAARVIGDDPLLARLVRVRSAVELQHVPRDRVSVVFLISEISVRVCYKVQVWRLLLLPHETVVREASQVPQHPLGHAVLFVRVLVQVLAQRPHGVSEFRTRALNQVLETTHNSTIW